MREQGLILRLVGVKRCGHASEASSVSERRKDAHTQKMNVRLHFCKLLLRSACRDFTHQPVEERAVIVLPPSKKLLRATNEQDTSLKIGRQGRLGQVSDSAAIKSCSENWKRVVDDDDDDVVRASRLFASQHSVVDLPSEAVLDVGETRSSQQGCILSSWALPALRLHQHVQGVELSREGAWSILVQQRLHQQHAASCRHQKQPFNFFFLFFGTSRTKNNN